MMSYLYQYFGWKAGLFKLLFLSLSLFSGLHSLEDSREPFVMTMSSWESLQEASTLLRAPAQEWVSQCVATWEDGSPKTVVCLDPVTMRAVKCLEYYEESGKLYCETDLSVPVSTVDGKDAESIPDGVQIYFFVNGTPALIRTFSQGKLHGVEKEFYENGGLQRSSYYNQGKLEGLETCYWFNEYGTGLRAQSSEWVSGLLHGKMVEYSESGEEQCIAEYSHGFLSGKMWKKIVHDDAEIVDEERWYCCGLLSDAPQQPAIVRTVRNTNKKIFESRWMMGLLHGVEREWTPDGREKKSTTYLFGKKQDVGDHNKTLPVSLQDIEEGFFSSGNKAYHFEYKNSLRSGKQQEFSEDGQVLISAEFQDGLRTGVYREYFENNPMQCRFECHFEKGALNGPLFLWTQENRLQHESYWKQGEKHGLVRDWNDAGVIIFEGRYVEGAPDGVHYERDDSGTLIEETHYLQGVIHGKYRLFHKNGKIAKDMAYENGLLHGLRQEYFDDGALLYKGQYVHGKPVGTHIKMSSKNKKGVQYPVLEECYDDQGRYQGVQKAYYNDGKLKSSISYLSGIYHGTKECYTETGLCFFLATYSNGLLEGRFDQTYSDGMKEERLYHKGLPDGKWRAYFPNETESQITNQATKKISFETEYVSGRIHGEYREFYANGQLSLVIPFQNGFRDGLSVIYSTEGKVILSSQFKNGLQEGKMIAYYPSGRILSESNFCHNNLQGPQIAYHENGREKSRMNYELGLLHGRFQEWADSGTLLYEGQYEHGKKEGLFKKYTSEGLLKSEMVYKNNLLETHRKVR